MFDVSGVRQADRVEWERLYVAYADFYQMTLSDETMATVWSWMVDEDVPFHGLVVRSAEGGLVGLAHYKAIPSPLRGTMVGFLDDLFIEPAYRGSGAIDALMTALKRDGESRGWPFIRWITKDNNYRARALYDRYATRTDWVTYQLDTTRKEAV